MSKSEKTIILTPGCSVKYENRIWTILRFTEDSKRRTIAEIESYDNEKHIIRRTMAAVEDLEVVEECLFSCCDISVGAPARCIILGEHSARYSRLKNCPLVEIPTPHGRLIDADELLKTFEKACDQDGYWVDFFALVESAPTIIEAEVSE